MKYMRYPILFILVILIPTSLASFFLETSTTKTIISYAIGYLLIYGFMQTINRTNNEEVYSKRMRTTYLITNAIISVLLFQMLTYAIALLNQTRTIDSTTAIFFVGLPWISVQLLLLNFFVRYESLMK